MPLCVGVPLRDCTELLDGSSCLPAASATVLLALELEAEERGWEALHEELRRSYPVAAERIHPNNRQRLMRALEVLRLTGKPISEFWKAETGAGEQPTAAAQGGDIEDYTYFTRWQADETSLLPYTVVQLAMMPPERRVLHERIRLRFLKMLDAGFLDEVRALMLREDLHPDLPSMRGVG